MVRRGRRKWSYPHFSLGLCLSLTSPLPSFYLILLGHKMIARGSDRYLPQVKELVFTAQSKTHVWSPPYSGTPVPFTFSHNIILMQSLGGNY